jgi:hypothetical protein
MTGGDYLGAAVIIARAAEFYPTLLLVLIPSRLADLPAFDWRSDGIRLFHTPSAV